MDFRLFIPLTKVDVEKRLVFGTLAEEIPDRAGEIMDYESARPEFEKWSSDIEAASDGRSVGNLRAMHGQVAAGKLESLAFDDAGKRIEACGKVVDDAEWQKVLEGVYTGFSMGGRYLKRWPDSENPSLTRYTPQPVEVSLVDNPCIPTATFEVVKADGSTELRKFRELAKAGARHSKEDLARVQAMHDTAVALGASCPASGDAGDDNTDDADESDPGDGSEKIAKREPSPDRESIKNLIARLEAQEARIAALETEPAKAGPVLRGTRVVFKGDETTLAKSQAGGDPVAAFRAHLDSLAPRERALALMKFSLANPLTR